MAFWVNIKRVSRYGVISFIRNGFISLAAILIMTITLFLLVNVVISNAALKATLQELTDKVDVTVYLAPSATEGEAMSLKQSLEALPEVASVTYTSREQALADFQERHKNDQLTSQALQELGANPFGASLEIRAKDTSQYAAIAKFLDSQQGAGPDSSGIEKVNFSQNRTAIDRLTSIIATSRDNGVARALLFGTLSLLIAFNTIRLAIYTAREEIGVMNLVGAGRWYVRGPFMIAGVLYGVISAAIVLVLLYPILLFKPVLVGLDSSSEILFGSFNSFAYYISHFLYLVVIVVATGVALGALSSYLAVRRYLRT